MTQWLTPEQQQVWRSFIVGTTLLNATLDRELRDGHGISLAEYEVLVRLSEQDSRCLRMAELAHSLSHSRSRVTHMIKRMERLGLVERRPADADRRGVEAVMTATGYQRLVEAAPTHVDGVRRHFVERGSEADYAATGRLMSAVCDHLLAETPEWTGKDIR